MSHFICPRYCGRIKNPTKTLKGENPICGDQILFQVELDKNQTIKNIGWQGAGCAISQAAASILAEMVKDNKFDQLGKITSQIFLKKLGLKLSPTRQKCALLALYTLKNEEINF